MCPVCFGTNLYDNVNQIGGVKQATRAWCIFTDHVVSEQYNQRGVIAPDQREVQCEAFPLLTEHDYIARVKRWDPITHTALSEPHFYNLTAVTRNSLRTGNRYGQTWEDVIGQKAQCNWLPPNTNGIQLYPIQNVSFPQAVISGTPVPTVTPQPDTHVVFYPVSAVTVPVTGGKPANFTEPFTYPVQVPTTPWVIVHTLDHRPTVTVIVNGEEVDADVDYPTDGTFSPVTITFATPQAGYAELI
jgi:hypothetical protein